MSPKKSILQSSSVMNTSKKKQKIPNENESKSSAPINSKLETSNVKRAEQNVNKIKSVNKVTSRKMMTTSSFDSKMDKSSKIIQGDVSSPKLDRLAKAELSEPKIIAPTPVIQDNGNTHQIRRIEKIPLKSSFYTAKNLVPVDDTTVTKCIISAPADKAPANYRVSEPDSIQPNHLEHETKIEAGDQLQYVKATNKAAITQKEESARVTAHTDEFIAAQASVLTMKNSVNRTLEIMNNIAGLSIYNNCSVININFKDIEVIQDLYTHHYTDTPVNKPPCFFNLVVNQGVIGDIDNYMVLSSGFKSTLELFNNTEKTFASSHAQIIVRWEPVGWDVSIHDPNKIEMQQFLQAIITQGSRHTQTGAMDRFFSRLDTAMDIFQNRRIIMYNTSGLRLDTNLESMYREKGIDLVGLINSISDNPRHYEIFDSHLKGVPVLSPYSSISPEWPRFACQRLRDDGVVARIGKRILLAHEGSNISAETFTFFDQFSATLLESARHEYDQDRLTRDQFTTLLNALKHEQTHSVIDFSMELPNFVTTSYTANDCYYLLSHLMLIPDIQQSVIRESSNVIQLLKLFREVETKDFFQTALLAKVTTAKRSMFIPIIEKFYSAGSLDNFLQMMLLEHYSAFFSVQFEGRVNQSSYLNLFSILDILIMFNIMPKVCWSNSVQLAHKIVTILGETFNAEYIEFRARYGIISEYVNFMWVPCDLTAITQTDTLGTDAIPPRQYSILVHTARDLSAHANAIFRFPGMINWMSNQIQLDRKRAANLPYASNLYVYQSSWPVQRGFNEVRQQNLLANRLQAVSRYVLSIIQIKVSISQLDQVKNDAASLVAIFNQFDVLIPPFARAISVFGNFISTILANGYFIWYDYLQPGAEVFGQPLLGFQVSYEGYPHANRSCRLLSRFDAVVDLSNSTYALINIVSLDQTIDSNRNKELNLFGLTQNAIVIPALPTSEMCLYFRQLALTARESWEVISFIASWYRGLFDPYMEGFVQLVTATAANRVAKHMAERLDATYFYSLLEALNQKLNFSIEMRGRWAVVLTNSVNSCFYNESLAGNTIFGNQLFTHTELSFNAYNLSCFLALGARSPLYNIVTSFLIHCEKVTRFIYDDYPQDIDYRQEIDMRNLPDDAYNHRIKRVVQRPHPDFPQSIVATTIYVLGNDEYLTQNDILRSGRRYLFIVDDPTCFMIDDFDVIHTLVLSGMIDILVMNMRLEYTIAYVSDFKDYYGFEAVNASSWVRNSFLKASNSETLLYTFCHNPITALGNYVGLSHFYRFVYLPRGFVPPRVIAEYILERDIPEQRLYRTLNTEMWQPLDNPSVLPDGRPIIGNPDIHLNNRYRYMYKGNVVTTIPEVLLQGSASIG